MHTAYDVKESMFALTEAGAPATRDALLDWHERDRLGVVIEEPVGALGAGLFTLLTTSAFYDVPGRKRRMRPLYPDIYLFHLGGRWGAFNAFDFFPDHKEVFVEPPELLRAINNRGITHLLLPDRPPHAAAHRHKEPEAFLDRIRACFAYDPSGIVADGDIEIRSRELSLLESFEAVLDPAGELAERQGIQSGAIKTRRPPLPPREMAIAIAILTARRGEIDPRHPAVARARARLGRARADGEIVERLRRITPELALGMIAAD